MRSNGVKNRISNYMIKHLTSLNINELGFKKLLTIMFSKNVFKEGSKFYKQINGLPMGCICGPTVANLYVFIRNRMV